MQIRVDFKTAPTARARAGSCDSLSVHCQCSTAIHVRSTEIQTREVAGLRRGRYGAERTPRAAQNTARGGEIYTLQIRSYNRCTRCRQISLDVHSR